MSVSRGATFAYCRGDLMFRLARPTISTRLLGTNEVKKRPFTTTVEFSAVTSGRIAHLSFKGEKKYPIVEQDSVRIVKEALTSLIDSSKSAAGPLRALFLRSTFTGVNIHYLKSISSPLEARNFIQQFSELNQMIQDYPVPVVAVVEGPCIGAGMEIVGACDLRIAVRDKKGTVQFTMPETKIGLPSIVHASLLPGIIGWGRAREFLYFGESIGVDKAYEWGLVNRVVDVEKGETVDEVIKEWEQKIDRTGPAALAAQKRMMRIWEERGTGHAGIEASIDMFGQAYETSEPSDMIQKFFDQRAASKKS